MNNLTTSFFYPNQRISLNSPSMTFGRFVFLKFSFSSFCFPLSIKMDNIFCHNNTPKQTLNSFLLALSNSSPPVGTSDKKSDSVSQKDLICVKEKKQSLLFFPKFFATQKTFLNANI